MSESPSKLDPAPRRLQRHIVGWGLTVIVVGSIVLWVPPARATLLVTLLGVIVSGVIGWRGTSSRQ
jgi:hypothetical protein